MRSLIILFTLLLFSSCISVKEPEFKGKNGYEMGKLSGSEVSFTLKPRAYNPNIYALKVKKSVLDLEVEGKNFGKIYLEKKIFPKAKKTSELQSGAMLKVMPLMLKDAVRVVIKGDLKGGVLGVSKKFSIEFDKKLVLKC